MQLFFFIQIFLLASLSNAIVILKQKQDTIKVCKGSTVHIKCTTVKPNHGILSWQVNQNEHTFHDNAAIGQNNSMSDFIFLILDKIKNSDGYVMYESTATLSNILRETTVHCSDAAEYSRPFTVTFKTPSKPSVRYPICTYPGNHIMKIAWEEPLHAGSCCQNYKIKITNRPEKVLNNKFITIDISENITYVFVHCWDGTNESPGTAVKIEAGITIESVTAAAVNSTDYTTLYQITWVLKKSHHSDYNPCRPLITNHKVTCLMSRNHTVEAVRKGEGTAYCKVENEFQFISATVILQNEAGFMDSKTFKVDRQDIENLEQHAKRLELVYIGFIIAILVLIAVFSLLFIHYYRYYQKNKTI